MRFIASGALDLPREKFDLHFATTEDCFNELVEVLTSRGMNGNERVHRIVIPATRAQLWKRHFDASCMRYRKISPSFDVRAESFKRHGRVAYTSIRLRALPGVYELRRAAYKCFLQPLPSLRRLLAEIRPDRVVIPSALLDNITDEILLACEKLRIPSLLLSLNWDNLSSKGLLTFLPNHMACWGEQTRAHARDIQRMPIENVSALGAPHFDHLLRHREESREALREEFGLPQGKKIILFAGSFREIDETAMLRSLDQAVEDGFLPNTHILYRPHPWRMHRQEEHFDSIAWKNVTMDGAMQASYNATRQAGTAADSGFDLDHLARLYRASDALISPMSTALLEAMHFDLPILALNFGDGRHYWSPDKAGAMLHFREFYDLPTVFVLREAARLVEATQELMKEKSTATNLDFFVVTKPGTYATRLEALLTSL